VDEQDSQLIRRCLSGEASAFEALYGAHAGRIVAYFLRSGFARADADDLTQETFTRAFRSLHTFDAERGAFRPWLATIARNVARKRWGRRAEPGNFDPELAEDVLAGADDPHAAAQQREEIEAVRDCVSRLPEELARIVSLRYVEGRSTRGVAAATGIPEATVRSRLAEAHERIERCLADKGVMG
jgi:RNA polymerase sigma-70 factor (ECF subfamily)